MENTLQKELHERKEYLEKLLIPVELRLQSAPAGTLRISREEGRVQYYHRTDPRNHNGTYLPRKQMETVRALAQKDYDRRFQKAAREELRAIDRFQTMLPDFPAEDLYEQLPVPRRELVLPAIETEETFVRSWLAVDYKRKAFDEDFPEFLTDKGERVRSKSEVILANYLAKENIPYRYEFPVYLKGFGIVHPDFTVLNVRLRREFFWEHLGMMDDPEYAGKSVQKIKRYIRNGIIPGKQLILTFETRSYPLNTQELRAIAEAFLK